MKDRLESKEENGISRKEFIKRTAAGLIGLGVASSFPINYGYSRKGQPENWEERRSRSGLLVLGQRVRWRMRS